MKHLLNQSTIYFSKTFWLGPIIIFCEMFFYSPLPSYLILSLRPSVVTLVITPLSPKWRQMYYWLHTNQAYLLLVTLPPLSPLYFSILLLYTTYYIQTNYLYCWSFLLLILLYAPLPPSPLYFSCILLLYTSPSPAYKPIKLFTVADLAIGVGDDSPPTLLLWKFGAPPENK